MDLKAKVAGLPGSTGDSVFSWYRRERGEEKDADDDLLQ